MFLQKCCEMAQNTISQSGYLIEFIVNFKIYAAVWLRGDTDDFNPVTRDEIRTYRVFLFRDGDTEPKEIYKTNYRCKTSEIIKLAVKNLRIDGKILIFEDPEASEIKKINLCDFQPDAKPA